MFRITVARSVVAGLCLLVALTTLRGVEPQADAVAQPPRGLSLLQLFRVGQYVSYSTRNNGGSYALSLYTEAEKNDIQTRYEVDLAVYEEYQRNRQLVAAKQRELMQELNGAEAADRKRILAELSGIGVEVGEKGRPVARRRPPPPQVRPRRPGIVRFYRVSEIGADYICLIRETRQLYIPVWSIQSASRTVSADRQEPIPKPGSPSKRG